MKTTETKMNSLSALMAKVNFDEDKVMRLIEKELRNREYHKVRNAKISQILKKAKELGL